MMLIDLLSDIREVIVAYLDVEDLKQLSLCNSSYNHCFREYLWRNVRIPFTSFIYIEPKTKQPNEPKPNLRRLKDDHLNLGHLSDTQILHLGDDLNSLSVQCTYNKEEDYVEMKKLIEAKVDAIFDCIDPITMHVYFHFDRTVKQMNKLDNLSELHLHDSKWHHRDMDGQVREVCKALPRLKVLCVVGQYLHDEGFIDLPNLTMLEELEVSGVMMCHNSTSDTTLQYIAKLKHLKKLTMNYSKKTTDEGVAALLKNFNLTKLCFHHCSKTDAILPSISSMTSLQVLKLSYGDSASGFTNEGFQALENLHNLRELDISLNSHITDSGTEFLHKLPALRKLNLRCLKITGATLKHLENIRELQIDRTCDLQNISPLITLTTLYMMEPDLHKLGCLHTLKSLTDLSIINAKDYTRISKENIIWLRSVPLKKLKLHDCPGTTDELTHVIGSIHSLHELELSRVSSYSVRITNKGVKELCGLKFLRKVSFYGCDGVGDEGIMQMASTLKFLKKIDVSQTSVSEKCALVLCRQFKLNVKSNSSW